MNRPDHAAIANKIFDRVINHSEAGRQEYIDKLADSIYEDMRKNLFSNKSDIDEIANDLLGYMSGEDMAKILKHLFLFNFWKAGSLLLNEARKAMRRIADHRATKQVEAMTPEDFLPD